MTGSVTNCGPPPARMTNPIFAYSHIATGCGTLTGGAFVPNGAWPGYDGAYLYADFICGKIFTLSADCGTWTSSTFAAGLGGVSELQFVGNELWYGTYTGQVHRIVPPPSDRRGHRPPVRPDRTRPASSTPATASAARPVSCRPAARAPSRWRPRCRPAQLAAVVNVTITGALAPGFVTAWPADQAQPAHVDAQRHAGRPDRRQHGAAGRLVAVQLKLFTQIGRPPARRRLRLLPARRVRRPRDGSSSLLVPRILDTRTGNGAPVGRVSGQLDVQVTGRGGVPASGVERRRAGADGHRRRSPAGFVTAWPTGQPRPERVDA